MVYREFFLKNLINKEVRINFKSYFYRILITFDIILISIIIEEFLYIPNVNKQFIY